MRYGKWHIEHITLPHAARVGLDRLSAETQLISSLESRIVICLRVDVLQSAAEQRGSAAKQAQQTQERFQRFRLR